MAEAGRRINVYRCPVCGWRAVTVNLVDGVTPMFIRCEGAGLCDASTFPICQSSMYRVDQKQTPTHEWYRPDHGELNKKPWARAHVPAGGLLLRNVGEAKGKRSLVDV